MSTEDAPFAQSTRLPRSRKLAASLVAGIALVAGPAFADPVEDAPVEEAQEERAPASRAAASDTVSDATAAEDAAVVLAGETPEAAVTRIEGEVATAETELTAAQECSAADRRAECPSAEAAQAALALRSQRLTRARRHESRGKRMRHHRAHRHESATKAD